MKAKLILFLFGALIGFLIAVLFRPVLQPMVAEVLRDEADRTEGRVVGKRLQGERLLLTVDATEGTILATFKDRVEEIDMLVEDGDLVTLGVPRYEPFVEDPPVLAVRKQDPPAATADGPEATAEPRPGRPPGEIVPSRAEPMTETPATAPGEPEAEEEGDEEPPAPEPSPAGDEADGEAEAEPPPGV